MSCKNRCYAVQKSFLTNIHNECKKTLEALSATHKALGAAIVYDVNQGQTPEDKRSALEANYHTFVSKVQQLQQSAGQAMYAMRGVPNCSAKASPLENLS